MTSASSPAEQPSFARARQQLNAVCAALDGVIVGQRDLVAGIVTAVFAGGHVLMEGLPGLGKTHLVLALSRTGEVIREKLSSIPLRRWDTLLVLGHRRQIEQLLGREQSNMSRVAEKAGLERTHLYRMLKQLNMRFARRGEDSGA